MSVGQHTAGVPFRPHAFLDPDVELEQRADGALLLRSRLPLVARTKPWPSLLAAHAAATPQRPWLAQRRGPDRAWQTLTYGEGKAQVDAVTQALLSLQARGRTVMLLSGNALEHAVMQLAAMQAGMPVAPVTPAYSLLTADLATLQSMADLLQPAVVFAQNGRQFERALRGLSLPADARIVCVDAVPALPDAHAWADWVATPRSPAVDAACAALDPGAVAKYLFTSGSTGHPKAVIITHTMLALSIDMHEQVETPEALAEPKVLLDWLPWSHVAAGNMIFGLALAAGGTTWIDEGKPAPGLFDETLRNLREVSPTEFCSVPLGFTMLVEALEHDAELARRFFSRLRGLRYAGAKLPDSIFDRMQAVAVRTTGLRVPFTSAFGSTETSASVTVAHWCTDTGGNIGVPHPGVELKLLPLGDQRYEVRVKSAVVTPGYLANPQATADAFDEDGYFRMGDALQFVDPARPVQGLVFAGRVSEDFKLQSGIFVRVGALRIEALESAHGLLSDVVVAGADEAHVALLAWPNLGACRLRGGDPEATMATLAQAPWLRDALRDAFRAHNAKGGGSSRRIHRVLLLDTPPDMGAGEITDKGYVNQRRVLARRADALRRLYAEPADASVIEID